MKAIITTILLIFFFSGAFTQELLMVNKGHVEFTSDAALELIEAESNKLEGILKLLDRSFVFRASMKSFDGRSGVPPLGQLSGLFLLQDAPAASRPMVLNLQNVYFLVMKMMRMTIVWSIIVQSILTIVILPLLKDLIIY